MNILRHDKNLLTVTEWLQWRQSKRARRMLLAKYAANYWLTYDRTGKHATNFKCLL